MGSPRSKRRAPGAGARCKGPYLEALRRHAVSHRSGRMARRVQQDQSADDAAIQGAALAQGDNRRDHLSQGPLDAETTAVPMGRKPARAVPGGAMMAGSRN